MTPSFGKMLDEIAVLVDCRQMDTFEAWKKVVNKYNLCEKEAELLFDCYENAITLE